MSRSPKGQILGQALRACSIRLCFLRRPRANVENTHVGPDRHLSLAFSEKQSVGPCLSSHLHTAPATLSWPLVPLGDACYRRFLTRVAGVSSIQNVHVRRTRTERARICMMNQRFALKWNLDFNTVYGRPEWVFISAKSVRRACMKEVRARDDKAKDIAKGKRLRHEVCSRYLVSWQISAHSSYKRELISMTRRQCALLSALRGGPENVVRFIFRCMQYSVRRQRMMRLIIVSIIFLQSRLFGSRSLIT